MDFDLLLQKILKRSLNYTYLVSIKMLHCVGMVKELSTFDSVSKQVNQSMAPASSLS